MRAGNRSRSGLDKLVREPQLGEILHFCGCCVLLLCVCVFRLKKDMIILVFMHELERKKNYCSLKLKFLNERRFIIFKKVKKLQFLFWKASVQSQATNHILKNPCVIVLISILVLVTKSEIEDNKLKEIYQKSEIRLDVPY